MNRNTDNPIYLNLARLWLVSILVILPFQLNIAIYIAPWSTKFASMINYLDELTIVIFLLFSMLIHFKNRKRLPGFFFYYYPL